MRRFLLRIPILSILLAGCTQEKPATVEGVHFPALVLYGNAYSEFFVNADDLKSMYVQVVISQDTPPTLVDSDLAIYHLNALRSIHGGLWLMANPSGATEVTFDLARAGESGLDAARAAIKAQLLTQTWRDDVKERTEKLEKASTLKEMYAAIQTDDQ
jgi:hypothetical protein